MKRRYSAILWREFNKDLKSWKIICEYLLVVILSILFYHQYYNFGDAVYFTCIGVFSLAFYHSVYFLNNITTVLCLPLRMSDYCVWRAFYKVVRMLLIAFISFIMLEIIYQIPLKINFNKVLRGLSLLFTLCSTTYLIEYLELIVGKRYVQWVVLASIYTLYMLKILIFIGGAFVHLLVALIDLLIFILVNKWSKTINLEKITRRWV